MPVKVEKRDGKYCVVEPGGSVVKCHATKDKASKHAAAININTSKGGAYGEEPKKKPKKEKTEALSLDDGMQPAAPKLVIMSDGTPGGSRVFVNGQEVSPKHMDFYCRKPDPSAEYEFERDGECSFSMGIEKTDGDFTKTVTVRMRSKADQEFSDAFVENLPPETAAVVRKALDKELGR